MTAIKLPNFIKKQPVAVICALLCVDPGRKRWRFISAGKCTGAGPGLSLEDEIRARQPFQRKTSTAPTS